MIYTASITAQCFLDTQAESREDARTYVIEILNDILDQYGIVDFRFSIDFIQESED